MFMFVGVHVATRVLSCLVVSSGRSPPPSIDRS